MTLLDSAPTACAEPLQSRLPSPGHVRLHTLTVVGFMQGPVDALPSAFRTWLAEHGAVHDALKFAASTSAGIGAFATRKIKRGTTIASIPHACVLSPRIARDSPLGKAARKAARKLGASEYCTDAVLLWIYMVVGRVDPSNPHHAYLASLPSESPDPACWSAALRDELTVTPIGPSIEAARTFADAAFDAFASKLPARLGASLVPEGCLTSASQLLWARGMCVSRSFPEALVSAVDGAPVTLKQSADGTELICPAASASASAAEHQPRAHRATGETGTGETGVLLPLFDLLNHCATQPLSWVGDAVGVRFVADAAIPAGAEVFNNYGARPNEELLLSYGYCVADVRAPEAELARPSAVAEACASSAVALALLPSLESPRTDGCALDPPAPLSQNPHDAFMVSLRSGPRAPDDDGGARSWEDFYVRRAESGGIPAELLQALSRACKAMRGEEGDEGEEGEGDEGDDEEEVELVLRSDELQLLLATVHAKLDALAPTEQLDRQRLGGQLGSGKKRKKTRDASDVADEAPRRLSVAHYRHGLRVVMAEAIEALEELLGEPPSQDEDDDEDDE